MEDIVFNIFGFLSIGDIVNCSLVNKLFLKVSKSQVLWKRRKYKNVTYFNGNFYESYKFCYGLTKIKMHIDYRGDEEKLHRLKLLNLECRHLKTIPTCIGLLYNLNTLFLNSNQMENCPSELGLLYNLERLDLSYNNLATIPKELCLLYKLHTLNLERNQLVILPTEIGLLRNLRRLCIQKNTKLKTMPTSLRNLKGLYLKT